MRLLIVSDLHATLAALERSGTAELARILRTGATRGRAPVPAAPVEAVR